MKVGTSKFFKTRGCFLVDITQQLLVMNESVVYYRCSGSYNLTSHYILDRR